MAVILLITTDADLIAAVAATGVTYETIEDADGARELGGIWPVALVGLDVDGDVDRHEIGADGVALAVVGEPAGPVWRRGVELGVQHVISLPDAGPWLLRVADGG